MISNQRKSLSRSRAILLALACFIVISSSGSGLLKGTVEYVLDATNVSRLVLYWIATPGASSHFLSTPVVANGVVYVAGDKLYAYHADTGKLLWTATAGSIISPPAVANGVVYVSEEYGKLYAFPAAGCGQPTCSPPLWSPTTADFFDSSPTIANEVVYIDASDAISSIDKLYAFHLPTLTP